MKYSIILIITALHLCILNQVVKGADISEDEAIKIFTLANEEYTKALKLMSANKTKEAKDGFKKASDQYEELIRSDYVNGQVYYNLANAYYRQGKAGKAMLFYNKAIKLIPRNSNLQENMTLVKTEFKDKEILRNVPRIVKTIFFWYFLFNINETTVLVLSLYIVFMVSILVFIFFKYQVLKPIYIGFGIAMIVTGITLGIKIYNEEVKLRGIVISQECSVRYGPGDEYEPKFLIHEGAEFVVKEENNEWYKVHVFVDIKQPDKDEDSTKEYTVGWLPKDKVGII